MKKEEMQFDKWGIKVEDFDSQTLRNFTDFFYCHTHQKNIAQKYCDRFNSNDEKSKNEPVKLEIQTLDYSNNKPKIKK